MNADAADEVLGIVQRICPVVMSSAVIKTGDNATALRRVVGMMAVDDNMLNPQAFIYAMCFALGLARRCGATLPTMDRVRKAALAETPVSLEATETVLNIVRLALTAEARIIAYTTFVSRDDVEATATAVNDAFSQTIEIAADDMDTAVYVALVNLNGDVVKHLSDRARQLPRVINYTVPTPMPALRMAQRFYGDARRTQELIDENNVVHPAFMPMTGVMLTV